MSVRDENVAIRSDHNPHRTIECIRSIPRDACLPQRHQQFSVGSEFKYLLALAVFSIVVRDPYVAVLIHVTSVRKHEHFRAEAFDQFARWVELENGRGAAADASI